jgi:hypothetical protein
MIEAAIALVVSGVTARQAWHEYAHGHGEWFAFYAAGTVALCALAILKARRSFTRRGP